MKTHPGIVKKVSQVLGNGNVVHHPTTEENKIGQSGVHTFIGDIMDIVEKVNGPIKNSQQTYRALAEFLIYDR